MRVTLAALRADEALRRLGLTVEDELAPADLPGVLRFSARHGAGTGVPGVSAVPAVLEVYDSSGGGTLPALRRYGALQHRNLLRVLQAGELHRGGLFLLHEAPMGLPLRELRLGGPLPFELTMEVLRQVAAGLAAVHQGGLGHGRVHAANIYERQDGQVALGPPRVAAKGPEEAPASTIAEDLQRLAGLCAELLAEPGAVPGELGQALRRLQEGRAGAPRGTFELYAQIEAAAVKGGLLGLEDSSSIVLPGGPSPGPGRGEASAPPGGDDDTTIEMEQLDPADLPAFAQGASLRELVGPLEGRPRAPAPPEEEEDDEDDPAGKTMPVLRLGEETPVRTRPSAAPPFWAGPARWLVPLGLTALLTLVLAAWVLLRAR